MIEVRVKVYDYIKYHPKSSKVAQIEYEINGYKIVCGGAEGEEIENNLSEDSIDEFHEYLILELANGGTATFRNSHVDMFKLCTRD